MRDVWEKEVLLLFLLLLLLFLLLNRFLGHFILGPEKRILDILLLGHQVALVFEPETFRCFGLKIGKFQIRFGKTRRGRLLYLSSRHFDVLALKSVLVRPYISTFLDG